MKNIMFTLIFTTAIFSILQSCVKKDISSNCLAILAPDTLRFNVVDKNTGMDLFFSNSPIYTTDQIYLTVQDVKFDLTPKIETSAKLGKHFIVVATGNASGTIKLYIANNLEHTLQYTLKKDETYDCPKYLFDKVVINGTQTEQNLNGRVILLKK